MALSPSVCHTELYSALQLEDHSQPCLHVCDLVLIPPRNDLESVITVVSCVLLAEHFHLAEQSNALACASVKPKWLVYLPGFLSHYAVMLLRMRRPTSCPVQGSLCQSLRKSCQRAQILSDPANGGWIWRDRSVPGTPNATFTTSSTKKKNKTGGWTSTQGLNAMQLM